MKIKISIIFLVLLSFFNIGAVSNNNIKSYSFDNLESIYINKSEFVENGSKIQYRTKNSIEQEKERVETYLVTNYLVTCKEVAQNSIKFCNDDLQIEAEFWKDDIDIYVVITVVNNNPNKKTEELTKILKGLTTEDFIEFQCYKYYKGRISFNDETEYTDDMCSRIYESNMISLNNGYTGSGYCRNGEKINFAISNYNTGAYIIIGTPIIFTTY
ncbi:MAG: hypothetical protein ACLRWO_16480 [Clostridium butyricum]|uniref:hypothetical protein n=1 Tax=Clostridium sp. TaxID=1506 RepID=UPI002901FCFC|nr:hypothetical protein [Clostridium sp.]MDU1604875.1 hypothetical protein [Clostridium sp.]MDU2896363.1 hypothetical protein [Clostridium sp.]MDU3008561.1 hypothetical protein [Clostridium sp.]MDU3038849.1 hypothetical protein [Clostridium sp.]MDU3052637.1 hypothetical protein [Clostridium sp.]